MAPPTPAARQRQRAMAEDMMDIRESLQQILESKAVFGDTFYDVFLSRYPQVQKFFKGVNMERQAVLVTMALVLVEQYYSNPYQATEKYLQYLGTRHCDKSVPKDLYPQWTEAMLATLEQFHREDWDDQLAATWREAIGRATELMLEGYQEHFSV